MVYIFFVQPGDMMTFDNEISIMQSVGDLKEKIMEKCRIPLEQQVLLINGGEPLDSQKNLCSYMAGTDTNPIYLFSTNYDMSKLDILRNLNYDDVDLKQRLLDCLSLPVSLTTVKTRAVVAQDFFSVAKLQQEFCESLVHEQHLQQQGWSAVIANLEDIVSEFRKRWDLFLKMYEDFIADRDTYDSFLLSFEDDKKILQKIPVIDTLLESQKDPMDCSKISEITTSTSETEPTKEITLYEWISSSDSKNSLDDLYELCKSNLKKFEKEIMPSLERQINETLLSAEKPERKEIEGLGKRLFDLEELLRKIKKYVEHQSDMAQSFAQNQNSVAHMKDTSILPDLCATHIQQMELIKHCHQKLMDDRNRIVKAKYELSKSLCARIGWVQNVEDKLWELDSLLVYFHEHLQRLRKHLEVFQQLHLAPITYMSAVVEVVRRRSFSQTFSLWASDLACQQLTIHNEEVTRRKEFMSQFEGHFLNALFPGMGDVPPVFATEAPPMFDAKLPKISEEDVEKLKREVPDFAEHLVLPNMEHVVNFFLGKISAKNKEDKVDDATAVEEKLMQAVSDVGLASNLDKNLLKATSSEPCLVSAPGLPNLKDDKGCESETDTEEFEKVGQSPVELAFPQEAVPKVMEKQDASTITEVRNQVLPPKKPPRSFRATQSFDTDPSQRTLSISTNESFTNIKNISLDSIDELSSIKNFTSTTDSCFNSHYNQSACKDQTNPLTSTSSSLHLSDVTSLSTLSKANVLSHYQSYATSSLMLSRSKSVSPQSPRDALFQEGSSLQTGHQPDFATDEFYIDESLPSSVGTGNSQGSEFVRQLDTANIVVAMLQDNLQISRSEHEKLNGIFLHMGSMAKQAIATLRTDLNELRTQFATESQTLAKQYEDLGISWETLQLQVHRNEKEIVECMRRENDGEKERFRYNLMEKEEVIKRQEEDKRAMEDRIRNLSQQLELVEEQLAKQKIDSTSKTDDLMQQLLEKDLDKDKCLKELSENLKMEHRAEIDNIKSRFKLMTMERSPSLTSLEKEKSGDFTSLPGHTTLLAQMTDNFELDKEKAVLDERKKWEKALEDKTRELTQKFKEDKRLIGEDVAKRVSEDKDKQIDVLREREKNLNLEIIKHKTTIQQLAEYQEDRVESDVILRIESLKRANEDLQQELTRLRNESASVPVCQDSSCITSGSELVPSPVMAKSETVSNRPHRLNIDTCKVGDIVLILWDQTHDSFRVLQETKHAYFLHPECLEILGLTISEGKPNKTHCTGEVVDKELCQVRKSTNRFRVPKGGKFFLVKVKPAAPLGHGPSDPDMTQSVYTPRDLTESAIGTEVFEPPEELIPKCIEKQLAEDSGIVDNVEQATAAIEDVDRLEEEQFWSLQEKHSLQDKNKLIERLQEREKTYALEISKYKTTIRQLTENQEPKDDSEEQKSLRQENRLLQEELAQIRNLKVALMSTSVAVCEAATSPMETSVVATDLSRSEIVPVRPHRLNIDSCKVGDIVLVLWDQAHENFKVLQESKHIYFLHSDCVEKLGLIISEGKPNRIHCTGEVVDKEYCQTRKSENRYKVPKGAKFFRVKVKPVGPLREVRDSSSRHASSMSTSHSVVTAFDPLIEESQPIAAHEESLVECDAREIGRSDSETSRTEVLEPPEGPKSTEKHFAEDSGIEEAAVAIESNDR